MEASVQFIPSGRRDDLIGETAAIPRSLMSRFLARTGAVLSPLAAVRDTVLVIGAGLYGVGYFAWAMYAWANGLGLLPALQFQYIVAGGVIGLFLSIVYLLVRGLVLLRRRLPFWLSPLSKWQRIARWGIFFGWSFSLLLFIIESRLDQRQSALYASMALVITSILVLPVPGLPERLAKWKRRAKSVRSKFLQGVLEPLISFIECLVSFSKFAGAYYVVFLTLFFIAVGLFLAVVLYLLMPQELGGVRPRCAYIDVETRQVSKEIQAALLAGEKGSFSRVERSARLDVLFSGSDFVLVRPRVAQNEPSPPVYEISRKWVPTITWCE